MKLDRIFRNILPETRSGGASAGTGRDIESLVQGEFCNSADTLFKVVRKYPELDLLEFRPELLLTGSHPGPAAEEIKKENLLFLDLETTGLGFGAGTYGFQMGIGRFAEYGFQVVQFFLKGPDAEPDLYRQFSQFISKESILVTFNGKSYDVPLLESRFRIFRLDNFLENLTHFDLLHSSRALWKSHIGSCTLQRLEQQVLKQKRDHVRDIPGSQIPKAYFEYLRHRNAGEMVRVMHHNRQDICSLVQLLDLQMKFSGLKLDEGMPVDIPEFIRWLVRKQQLDLARSILEKVTHEGYGLTDLEKLAVCARKLRLYKKSLKFWNTAASMGSASAGIAAAEILEKQFKDIPSALERAVAACAVLKQTDWVDARLIEKADRIRIRLEKKKRKEKD